MSAQATRRIALHHKAERLAFRYYLRCGYVPPQVQEILQATASWEALEKYSPDQPRAPRGNPDGGQWVEVPGYARPKKPGGGDRPDPESVYEIIVGRPRLRLPRLVPKPGNKPRPQTPRRPRTIDEIDDPPLEPVYALEIIILTLLPAGRLFLAWTRWVQRSRESGENVDHEWKFGRHKQAEKWARRIEKWDWTPERITDLIKNGERYRVENRVNRGNAAIQYSDPKTGRFVVRDEVTREILQISRPDYKPNPPVGK